MSLPTSPLRLLPTAATFVGWDSHPLKFRAFSRRTYESRLGAGGSVEAKPHTGDLRTHGFPIQLLVQVGFLPM